MEKNIMNIVIKKKCLALKKKIIAGDGSRTNDRLTQSPTQ